MTKKVLLLALCFSVIFGCNSDKAEVTVTQQINTIPPLNSMEGTTSPLMAVDVRTFQRHLRNGVYLRSKAREKYPLTSFVNKNHAVTSLSYSVTNTQEHGISEGDRIKYNQQHIFIATNPFYDALPAKQPPAIKILARHPQGDISPIARVPLMFEDALIESMYITDNRLVALSNQQHFSLFASENITENTSFFPSEQRFYLSLVDISEPSQAKLLHNYSIDGRLIDSRRVGDKLYVISSYAPYLPGLPIANNETGQLENYRKIFSAPITDFLPKLTNSQGVASPLIANQQCLIPTTSSNKDGFDGITTLTVIDINEPESITSLCINSDIQGLYASKSAMYLYGTTWSQHSEQTSVIHKFAFDKHRFYYRASAELAGGFGQHQTNLRFSEYQSMLRVVTTEGSAKTGFEHRLFILKESTNKQEKVLNILSQLPNDEFPKKIGKTNLDGIVQENIKAVRFVDNRAYIVTFLTTDPLYIVDLSTPNAPYISGELSIPGYSSYLHPISEQLLLGIGQNMPENQLENTNHNDHFPIVQGAKISLFDISNINAPKEIASLIHPTAYTPVEFNYHALTHLSSKHNAYHRFGIPMEHWRVTATQQNQQKVDNWIQENYFTLFEVTSSESNAQLVDIGDVYPHNDTPDVKINFISSLDDRAIFDQQDIYYLHGNKLWRTFWFAPENVLGPY